MRPSFRYVTPKTFDKVLLNESNGLYDDAQFPRKAAPLGNRQVFEGYLNSELALQLDLSVLDPSKSESLESEEFCLIFKKIAANEFNTMNGDPWTRPEFGSDLKDGCTDHMQPSVPIESRAIMQYLQVLGNFVVRITGIISNVWLYRMKPIPKLCREWSLVDGITVEFRFVDTNWELGFIAIGGGIDPVYINQYLINEGVKSRSQLVEKLSKLKRNVVLGEMGKFGFGNSLPVIRYLDPDGMSFRLTESLPFKPTGFTMKYSSVDAPATIGE